MVFKVPAAGMHRHLQQQLLLLHQHQHRHRHQHQPLLHLHLHLHPVEVIRMDLFITVRSRRPKQTNCFPEKEMAPSSSEPRGPLQPLITFSVLSTRVLERITRLFVLQKEKSSR